MKLVIKKSSIDDGLVRPLYLIYYHFNAIIVPNSLYNSTILKKIDTWSRIKEFNVEINIGTFWDGGLGFGTWEIYLLPSVAALLEIGVGSGLKWTCLGRVLHAGWRPPSFNLLLFCVRVPSADRTLRPLPRRHARELDCPPPTVACHGQEDDNLLQSDAPLPCPFLIRCSSGCGAAGFEAVRPGAKRSKEKDRQRVPRRGRPPGGGGLRVADGRITLGFFCFALVGFLLGQELGH